MQPKYLILTITSEITLNRFELMRESVTLEEMKDIGRQVVTNPIFAFTKYIIEIYYFTSNMDKVTLFERRV
jgi:hypothetical protein